MIEELKKKGFLQAVKGSDVYVLRIHDLIYLEIDTRDNFAALRQKNEWRKGEAKIHIPNPVKNKDDLDTLLLAIIGK